MGQLGLVNRPGRLIAVAVGGVAALVVGYGVVRALDRPDGDPVAPINLDGPATPPTATSQPSDADVSPPVVVPPPIVVPSSTAAAPPPEVVTSSPPGDDVPGDDGPGDDGSGGDPPGDDGAVDGQTDDNGGDDDAESDNDGVGSDDG